MTSRCSGCVLAVTDGTAGCQALFEELQVRAHSDFRYARVHRVVVDTYCLQLPDRNCVSAKSLAAHLTGLAWALEYGGHLSVGTALLRFLNGTPSLKKPELPSSRGALTVADVEAAEPDAYAATVERWARSTWEAYAALHPLAHRWVEEALAGR